MNGVKNIFEVPALKRSVPLLVVALNMGGHGLVFWFICRQSAAEGLTDEKESA